MADPEHTSLKLRSIRAVKWSALGELLVRSAQPLMLLVLTKVLSPQDFGVVGIAMIAIGIAQVFQEFGIGKALVQTRGDIEAYASNAFWINTVAGLAVYGAIYSSAGSIAEFFHNAQSESVLRVLGVQIVLTSLIAVPMAMLQREIRFKTLFFLRFLPTLVVAAVSLPLAFCGHGVWALVWGTLAGAVVQVMLVWTTTAWRPRLHFNRAEFGRMFTFSKWIWLESALAWVVVWGDSIALGHYLGAESLGLYRVGSVVIAYLSNIIFTPIVPVAFGFLSRLQDDPTAFADILGKLTRIVVMLSLPIGVGAALVGRHATIAILGEEWADAGVVVQLMGLRMGLEWLVGLNSTAFVATGHPEVNVKTLLIAALISVPAYLWAAPFGLAVFCCARLAAAQMTNLIAFQFARTTLRLPSGFLWQRVRFPLAACGLMAGAVFGLARLGPAVHPIYFGGLVLTGAAVYVGALWMLDQSTLSWSWNALRRMLISREPELANPKDRIP